MKHYSIITINGCKIVLYKGEWLDEMFIKIPPQKVNELKKEALCKTVTSAKVKEKITK